MKKILYSILILLIITLGILLYSRFIGTIGLKTNENKIETNIAESYDGLKIIHFSDLHYKKVITEKRVTELRKEINKNKPDIVLFTGDLLDNDSNITNTDINFLISELSKIESTYGNYAILGDNDYSKEETVNNIYIQSNFTLLKNSSTVIINKNNDKLLIAGLESYNNNKANIDSALESLEEPQSIAYKIVLIHEPDYIPKILEKDPTISLILAGHSINGSINIPIIRQFLLPKGAKNYNKPYNQENNTNIYISNGIGVNNINFRLFNTPSINLYRIKKL